jgi:hypothetical protein
MSVISPVPPPVRPAGTGRRASQRGYWIGGGLVAAAFIGAAAWIAVAFLGFLSHVNGFQRMTVPGTATVQVTQPGTRVVYYESPRAASPPGQLLIRVTGPKGEPVEVSAYHGDVRYDVPGVAGRAGKAIASFQAAAAGDYRISAGPGATGGTLAIGGDVLWDVVPHLAGAAAVFVLAGGAGLTLIIVTAMRRSARPTGQRVPTR